MRVTTKMIELSGMKHAKETVVELMNEVADLTAERDRLRAALEQLAALNDSALAIEYVRGIARAALNQNKE